jgi:hypothetical protein
MTKARKILSNTINELLKETSLETRIKMSCWFVLNNMIHDSGAREESAWNESNPRDIELMRILDDKTKELTDKILKDIKEWEEDGKPE